MHACEKKHHEHNFINNIPQKIVFHPQMTLLKLRIYAIVRSFLDCGRYVYCSNAWLSDKCNVKRDAVIKSINSLVCLGFIERKTSNGQRYLYIPTHGIKTDTPENGHPEPGQNGQNSRPHSVQNTENGHPDSAEIDQNSHPGSVQNTENGQNGHPDSTENGQNSHLYPVQNGQNGHPPSVQNTPPATPGSGFELHTDGLILSQFENEPHYYEPESDLSDQIKNNGQGGIPKDTGGYSQEYSASIFKDTQLDQNTSPKTINIPVDFGQKSTSGRGYKFDSLFMRFYRSYPRREKPHRAYKAFLKLKPDFQIVQMLVEDVEQRKKNNWSGRSKSKIPHPATYINSREWEGDIIDSQEGGKRRWTAEEVYNA